MGPLARYTLNSDRLSPIARAAASAAGLGPACRNPFRSILVEVPPRGGEGYGASEAPRGICFHRYVIDDDGLITDAQIVPPSSQNQASVEADLRMMAEAWADLDDHALPHRCEQAIRNYDPCISCAAHFLDLTVERSSGQPASTGAMTRSGPWWRGPSRRARRCASWSMRTPQPCWTHGPVTASSWSWTRCGPAHHPAPSMCWRPVRACRRSPLRHGCRSAGGAPMRLVSRRSSSWPEPCAGCRHGWCWWWKRRASTTGRRLLRPSRRRCLLFTAGVKGVSGMAEVEPSQWSLSAVAGTAVFLLIAATGEETGWRGVALPALIRRLRPGSASLVLGTLVDIWPVPYWACKASSRRMPRGTSLPISRSSSP